jgi:hypothetical protein
MYTWEIENYLKARNYKVTREEFIKVVSLVENPQITEVLAVNHKDIFRIKTSDNGDITFSVKLN